MVERLGGVALLKWVWLSWRKCATGGRARQSLGYLLQMENGTRLKEKCVTMQSFDFARLVFHLTLVQHFLTVLPFGKVMSIMCHCMLEICNLLLGFDFT